MDYQERCNIHSVNPSLRNLPLRALPALSRASFVAPNTVIIGQVTLGQGASVWYGSVLRGDLSTIEVGDSSIIQDLVVLHSREPIHIGRHVIVGPNCRVGGCMIKDYSFIGMGSTIEDAAVIESYAVVAAGSYVPRGTTVPSGQIWAGNPAVYLRAVTTEERESLHEHLNETRSLACVHSEETEKSVEVVFLEDVLRERAFNMNFSETLWERFEQLGQLEDPIDAGEPETVRGADDYIFRERMITEIEGKPWRPFTEDAMVYPEGWKVYGEDMERYERAKRMFEEPSPFRDETPTVKLPRNDTPWTRRY